MLRNYLKVAFRYLWRNKVFSLINITGLTLGLAAAMLILLWVGDERQMDASVPAKDRLFIVYMRTTSNGQTMAGTSTPGLLAGELKRKIPQVEAASGFAWTSPASFAVGQKIVQEATNFADSDFFRLMHYPLLEGNAATALTSPSSMAISRKMAVALFGSPAAAMGKTVRYEDRLDLTVSAVFEDLGPHVSAPFQCLINWQQFMKDNDWLKRWGNSGPSTYVLLRPGTDAAAVRKAIAHLLDAYVDLGPGMKRQLDLQQYSQHYLYGDLKDGYPAGGRIEYVRLFSAIAFFVLFIACINFMNLTTGRSMRRAREVGVRKVMGAVRGRLILQFIGEAILVALFSMGLALVLVRLCLPAFNGFTGKQIDLPIRMPSFWLELGALAAVTGILSGSYPAFYLSSFRPVVVLKGALGGNRSSTLRKALVVFQFGLSIVLITGALIVSRQVNYILNKDLGYDRENLLYVPLNGPLSDHYAAFHTSVLALPGVSGMTAMTDDPTHLNNTSGDLNWEGKDPKFVPSITQAAVGYDFIRTMKLQLAEGRDFSRAMPTDSAAVIVNESAVTMMGLKHPIGQRISFWNQPVRIIGVVHDFHFQSLHDPIRPLLLRFAAQGEVGTALVRVEAAKTRAVLDGLGKLWRTMNPKFPFVYQFSDLEYAKLYKSEGVVGVLSTVFALLAIVISCLGLLGLSMFTVEQRTKEIGIRKVLGARATRLYARLSLELLGLVGIAFLIAAPLGWFFMQHWLAGYAYQTPLGVGVFLWSAAMTLITALATVSYQSWKAANGNPVDALRSE